MSEIHFRIARTEDVVAYYGHLPGYRMRGIVATEDGKPVGLSGVFYLDGYPIAFSEMKPAMRSRRKDIARGVRITMDFLDNLGTGTFAVPNAAEPNSTYLLVKLGYKPTGSFCDMGEYFFREAP